MALLIASGCENSTGVSGTATYNGAPIANGAISFHSADGAGATAGAQIVSGNYRIDKIAPGSKVVVIEGFDEIPFESSSEEAGRRAEEALRRGPITAADGGQAAAIPRHAQGNGATVEIQPGQQTLDFHLTAAGQTPTGVHASK